MPHNHDHTHIPDLVVARPEGLYCVPGKFYIDPWRAVDRAVITPGHADHSRTGHAHYLTTAAGEGILRSRFGSINLYKHSRTAKR
ncbi:hypothetical protein GCM10022212_11340 [Actimicrobium antarcticum]|uniref:DNA ligase-associated DEXH box helicase n=1 Tax=Actimicrobium antarcticum TaxID=1051899 RepID=A0ABP7SW86_9BURK